MTLLTRGSAFLALSITLLATSLHAATLDQFNEGPIGNAFNASPTALNWQQKVTVGTAGTLHSFQIDFAINSGSRLVNVYLNLGSGWQTDAKDYFTTRYVAAGWQTFNVSFLDLGLEVGDQFSIGIVGTGQAGANIYGTNSND